VLVELLSRRCWYVDGKKKVRFMLLKLRILSKPRLGVLRGAVYESVTFRPHRRLLCGRSRHYCPTQRWYRFIHSSCSFYYVQLHFKKQEVRRSDWRRHKTSYTLHPKAAKRQETDLVTQHNATYDRKIPPKAHTAY
jgi:hypothetical protein